MSPHCKNEKGMKTLRLILGDQLNAAHPWFESVTDDVVYLMAEMRQETDYAPHHIQKVRDGRAGYLPGLHCASGPLLLP